MGLVNIFGEVRLSWLLQFSECTRGDHRATVGSGGLGLRQVRVEKLGPKLEKLQ